MVKRLYSILFLIINVVGVCINIFNIINGRNIAMYIFVIMIQILLISYYSIMLIIDD